jgi:hypothetical protein
VTIVLLILFGPAILAFLTGFYHLANFLLDRDLELNTLGRALNMAALGLLLLLSGFTLLFVQWLRA